jgi:hypothetical protein
MKKLGIKSARDCVCVCFGLDVFRNRSSRGGTVWDAGVMDW